MVITSHMMLTPPFSAQGENEKSQKLQNPAPQTPTQPPGGNPVSATEEKSSASIKERWKYRLQGIELSLYLGELGLSLAAAGGLLPSLGSVVFAPALMVANLAMGTAEGYRAGKAKTRGEKASHLLKAVLNFATAAGLAVATTMSPPVGAALTAGAVLAKAAYSYGYEDLKETRSQQPARTK